MPPKQKKSEQRSDEELIAIIAGALAIAAPANATAATLAPLVGIPVAVLIDVLKIAMSRPYTFGPPPDTGVPTAATEAGRLEPYYRAQYVLAASRRAQAALKEGGPAVQKAAEAEDRYFNQHLEAMLNRARAANAVDRATKIYGDMLGWYARLDNRTSPECREANGKNFHASVRPPIGYPGSVHPHCRCKPGKPFPTKSTVYGIQPEKRAS
jgi:SPP1 gp7 family putative phage head morphogenesis protein